MKKTLQRGFTLIELLVVIAIIGILAAVVLGSLNDARDGGRDASVKTTLSNARSQMEILFNNNSFSYQDQCQDNSLDNMFASIVTNSPATSFVDNNDPTPSNATTAVCHDNVDSWAISTPINAGGYFCVDSTGQSMMTTTNLTASTYVCS